MPRPSRYIAKTVLIGLIGTPLGVSLGFLVLWLAIAQTGVPVWAPAVAAVLLVQVPLWLHRGRAANRPSSWGAALLPVALPPAAYLLGWVVVFGVTGLAYGTALTGFAFTPFLPLVAAVLFAGSQLTVPIVLVLMLLTAVGAFWLGSREDLAGADRRWLIGALTAAVALTGLTGVQLGQAEANARLVTQGEEVSQEVVLAEYLPFSQGNRLVVPDSRPSLSIAEAFPVLDGATAAYPVYAAMGQAIYQVPEGTSSEDFALRYLDCTNTSGGYERLIAGDVDVFFGAQPSQRLLDAASAAGKELVKTPIGREAFVLFVNADNPVNALTTAQVQDIYARRITNWNQVGGRDEQIIPFQRPEDSGSQTIMRAKVMQGRAMADPLRDERITGMGGMVSEVADYHNSSAAIGYSFRWYATVMNARAGLKLLTIDGVEPSVANIRNGTYPFTIDVYAVTAGTSNPNVPKLLDWVVSDEGQALVEKVGYVGVR